MMKSPSADLNTEPTGLGTSLLGRQIFHVSVRIFPIDHLILFISRYSCSDVRRISIVAFSPQQGGTLIKIK